jgi:hypothetical protein
MDDLSNHDDWQACPPGELARMAKRLDAGLRGARFSQLAVTGLMSLLICAAGIILLGGFVFYSEPTFGGISCTDCLAQADEYHGYLVGKNPTMDPDLAGKIKKHLQKCGYCRAKFHESYPDTPLGPLAQCQSHMPQCLATLSVAFKYAGN